MKSGTINKNNSNRFTYSPSQNSSSSTNSNEKSNQKDDKFRFNYSPQQNASSTEEKQQQKSISPSLLPIFNTFICSYFNYKDFIPKAGLAYCFFAEINEQTYRVFFFLANLPNFLAYLIHLTFSDSVITPAPNACAHLLASLTNQK